MLKTNKPPQIVSSASNDDELVAVKSDLVLLPSSTNHKENGRKPRIHIVVNKRPSFHIDPEEQTSQGLCSKNLTFRKTVLVAVKLAALLAFLYFFVASLNLLASAFRLIGGRTASAVFRNSEVLSNPMVGLMIGVIVTVVVQSSSTSSSIIVSMVAAEFINVRTAIPIIMGANIGTSVTNTLVSFGQVNDREQFERAIGGATVHDMFNFLTVLILLPMEMFTGYLETLTKLVINSITLEHRDTKIEILSKITKPLTNQFVKIDKKVLEAWSLNNPEYENATLLKSSCDVNNASQSVTCDTLAGYVGLGDLGTGIFLLFFSLFLLCTCLVGIVRILSSILRGSVATIVQRVLNADLPYVPCLTGYLAILIGAVLTFMLQSSSIFTSSLTPLVGMGMISLERMYPLTLGSNLGTTTTAILAALASDGSRMRPAIQIALVHFFFNLSGMMLFYPVPFMRFPIQLAKRLGKITADYRWFAAFYLILAFIIIPTFVFSVSLGGHRAMYGVFIPLFIFVALILMINMCQKRSPKCLPSRLRSWHWLPLWMRSLEPMDGVVSKCCCCKRTDANTDYSPVVMQHTPSFDYESKGICDINSKDDVMTEFPAKLVFESESVT